jgi:TrmH family RNA methyltransferase
VPDHPEFDRLRVILVNTRNPLNIGAVARAMSNFGALRLRLVTPYQRAYKEARSAVGASTLLAAAEEYDSVADAIADCTLVIGTTAIGHRELLHPLKDLREGAGLIRERLTSGYVALLFGSERFGLSNDDLAHCHWLMHIPTREEHLSMNLGQAVAVCLYELGRGEAPKSAVEEELPASAGEIERIAEVLVEALRTSGYEAPGTEGSTERRVRRWLRRLSLREADAALFVGMLWQIVWKLKNSTKVEKPSASRSAKLTPKD